MGPFLIQATIYLAAAVIAVPLAKRLGLGSILGYLIAGVVIGQVGQLIGAGPTDLHFFADFGVVMLLFVIGLELEPKVLWDMRDKLLGLGGLQIGLTTAAIAAAVNFFGLPWPVSIAVGMTFALSSTAMVLQTLDEKRLTQTNGGRSSLSVLLTQDVAVIPMLVIIPLLGGSDSHSTSTTSTEDIHAGEGVEIAQAFLETLPAFAVAGIMACSIAVIILGGHFLTRPLFRYIAKAGLMEISTAATLFLVASAALLMTLVGLSPALGTFLAGVVLANSEFRHEMESNIAPFKGLFLGLFFIIVGAGVNFKFLFSDFGQIVGMAIGVMVIKAAVLLLLARLFSIRGRDQWLFTLGLAQTGEFGLLLVNFMRQTGVIEAQFSETLLLIVTISMVLTPALFIGYEFLARRTGDPANRWIDDEVNERGPIIIAGVGRFGQIVNHLLGANGFRTIILDSNIDTISSMRKFGYKAFLGDPTRPELLEAAGIQNASVLVVAMDDSEQVEKLVRYARRRRPSLYIVARAKNRVNVFELYQTGANQIIRETLDSSLRAGRYVLQKMGIPEDDAHRRVQVFFQYERNATRELAAVWDPNVPIDKNEAYIQRVKDLDREINLELGTDFHESGSENGGSAGGRLDPTQSDSNTDATDKKPDSPSQ